MKQELRANDKVHVEFDAEIFAKPGPTEFAVLNDGNHLLSVPEKYCTVIAPALEVGDLIRGGSPLSAKSSPEPPIGTVLMRTISNEHKSIITRHIGGWKATGEKQTWQWSEVAWEWTVLVVGEGS